MVCRYICVPAIFTMRKENNIMQRSIRWMHMADAAQLSTMESEKNVSVIRPFF